MPLLFDLLVQAGRSLLAESLVQRRAVLAEKLAKVNDPRLLFSEGVVGPGRALFDHVVAQGHEGIMAKDLRSRYRPGQRSPAWRKIKPTQTLPRVIIGNTPTANGLHSLLVASVRAGALRYVAQLTRGLAASVKTDLARRLGQRRHTKLRTTFVF